VAACYEDSAPPWARELPAVQVLRTVLVQNFYRDTGGQGREVIRRREPEATGGDGIPPAHIKVSSPYDADARWGAKGDLAWLGCKLHVTGTCEDPPGCGCVPDPAAARPRRCACDVRPDIITGVATTDATVHDSQITPRTCAALAAKGLPPARLYADSGYASPDNVLSAAREHGITLITPLLADRSRQARQDNGYDRSAFTIDYDARTATCPQGSTSHRWYDSAIRGKPAVIVQFHAATCRSCPARARCTTAKGGRGLTLPPRELHEVQAAARAAQDSKHWREDYARRAGIEATISQAVTVTGSRRARYRGLARTHLEHVYSAIALNLWRLDAYWNDTPIDRERTSHLARLDQSLRLAALTSQPGRITSACNPRM